MRRRQPHGGHGGLEPLEVGGQDGRDVGADGGRARALELADLGEHLAREEDGQAGQRGPQAGADLALVAVVEEGVEQADGDRLRVVALDEVDGVVHVLEVERLHDGALRVDPLGHLEAEVARHEDGGSVLEEIVEARPGGAAQLEDVAQAPRRDERRAGAPALEEGVGHHGGGVGEPGDLGRRHPALPRGGAQRLDHAAAEVAGRRRDLDHADPAPRLVHEHDVGEGAADVDADPPAHGMIALVSAFPDGITF